ncbi:pentapeptide repeat-containing protein [Legionella parisiensis]|uniref:Pentapeptide repeat protein MfpA n=1 Tax=Legionella parisiensis TaxID=45071 RepID=A0A1E5JTQ4_9GAMM|nr:pentapeptide repeat-containing protein [Legionella parisiensis]KTD40735.1 Pentapeptide repeats (8 copies) [Legionella parisiensis]OEH47901.1 hypothetical protein lpari_01089 [Legionella parisiensis]STX76816.1 Uncharacterized protein conserved in bacteria [Legionella parisiensis]
MTNPFNDQTYLSQVFTQLTIEKTRIEQVNFESCRFKQCKFIDIVFRNTKFTDCDFENCYLALATFPGCKFSEVSFKNSKIIGVNWTELSWPLVKLTSPLYFYNSNLSHSSFYGLELSSLIIEECKAHDVDFREANLSHASFVGSDLLNSLFLHTNLNSADFTNAINYAIDPNENKIKHARFSFPDVITLLDYFDIKINDWPNSD